MQFIITSSFHIYFRNSLSLVFCSDFAQESGTCSEELEADEDGFYLKGQYPCQHFNNGNVLQTKVLGALMTDVTFDTRDTINIIIMLINLINLC